MIGRIFRDTTQSYEPIINLLNGELAYETVNELYKDKYEGRQLRFQCKYDTRAFLTGD